jgi:hypothetical protein
LEEVDDNEDVGSAAKGKQGELIAIGKLLLKGHKVYLPVVDTGVDFLVDVGSGNYKEVQAKYREGEPTFTARDFEPRDSFYVICYFHGKHDDDFWIVPSKVFKQLGRPSKIGKRNYIQLSIGKEGSHNYNSLAMYHGNWGVLLSGASAEVRKAVERAEKVSKRVEGEHFKQPDFERYILNMLSAYPSIPTKTVAIMDYLKADLEDKFSKWDLEIGKSGEPRWQKTVAYTLYQRMKPNGLIRLVSKGEWQLTEKGIQAAKFLEEIEGHRVTVRVSHSTGKVTEDG